MAAKILPATACNRVSAGSDRRTDSGALSRFDFLHRQANTALAGLDGERVRLECVFTGRERETRASTVVMVTARESREALYRALVDRIDVVRIGDCLAPGTIAACVRSGHDYAQEMDAKGDASARRELPLRGEG